MTDFTKGIGFKEAVDYAASRGIVLPEVYYGSMVGIQHSQAVSIAGLASIEQVKYVIDQMAAVMKGGGTFKDFQKAVKANTLGIDLPQHRLDNIFRTNIQAAYSRGRWEQQTRVRGSRPYLMYDAINDSRVRPAHGAMDNTILKWDHPWWKIHYPPNGYRCRCTVISLTEAQAKKRGITELPPEDAPPDEGWDYNPGEDYGEGPDRGTKKAVDKIKVKVPAVSKTIDKTAAKIAAKAAAAKPATVDSVMKLGHEALGKLNTLDPVAFDKELSALLADRVLKKPLSIVPSVNRANLAAHVTEHTKGMDFDLVNTTPHPTVGLDSYVEQLFMSLPLPARWLRKTADMYKKVTIQHSENRAFCDQVNNILSINTSQPSVMLHEFMHLVQVANPEVQTLARDLHNMRAATTKLRPLKEITGNRGYSDAELAREDKYFEAYMGKEYVTDIRGFRVHNEPLEVLTVAFQALLGGFQTHSNRMGYNSMRKNMLKNDPDTAAFALGLLLHYADL